MPKTSLKTIISDREFQVDVSNTAIHINQTLVQWDKITISPTAYHVLHNGISHTIHVVEINKIVLLKINGKPCSVALQDAADLLLNQMGFVNSGKKKINNLKAPMPGLVVDICVEEGQTIAAGEVLLKLEAMKMENNIKALAACTIKKIQVDKGQSVDKNQVLITFQ